MPAFNHLAAALAVNNQVDRAREDYTPHPGVLYLTLQERLLGIHMISDNFADCAYRLY